MRGPQYVIGKMIVCKFNLILLKHLILKGLGSDIFRFCLSIFDNNLAVNEIR
jgi:hypothetical protein